MSELKGTASRDMGAKEKGLNSDVGRKPGGRSLTEAGKTVLQRGKGQQKGILLSGHRKAPNSLPPSYFLNRVSSSGRRADWPQTCSDPSVSVSRVLLELQACTTALSLSLSNQGLESRRKLSGHGCIGKLFSFQDCPLVVAKEGTRYPACSQQVLHV